MDDMIEAMKEMLENDEIFILNAKVIKKNVDSLIEEGFSRDEAIRLIVKK